MLASNNRSIITQTVERSIRARAARNFEVFNSVFQRLLHFQRHFRVTKLTTPYTIIQIDHKIRLILEKFPPIFIFSRKNRWNFPERQNNR